MQIFSNETNLNKFYEIFESFDQNKVHWLKKRSILTYSNFYILLNVHVVVTVWNIRHLNKRNENLNYKIWREEKKEIKSSSFLLGRYNRRKLKNFMLNILPWHQILLSNFVRGASRISHRVLSSSDKMPPKRKVQYMCSACLKYIHVMILRFQSIINFNGSCASFGVWRD